MKKRNNNPEDAASLRQKAEEQLKKRKDKTSLDSDAVKLKLIHELEVHQIELELQNEELVAAKEKAELAEEKYTDLYDFAPSGYLSLTIEGIIANLNFAAARMLGKERSKLINSRFAVFLSKNTRPVFNQFLDKAFTAKEKQNCEAIIETNDKSEPEPIYVIIDGITDQNDKLCQLTVVDISKRKQAEQEIISAKEKAEESNRLKTAFLNNMSHEIRTPLNGITGFIELLKDPEIDDEQKQLYFDIINKSSDRLIATVTDIIDISRIEAGEVKVTKTEVSINEILKEQYNFFYSQAQSKGLELIYKPSLSESEACSVTDKHKLEGILTNLIKNAIKFTDQGGITFACSLRKEQDIEFLEFYVKDTGIGIPANRIEAIFNRFEQADIEDIRVHQGSGLGLAIAKSYIEMLGGVITVSSEVGLGSTFTFSIPYTKQLVKGSNDKDIITKEPKTALSNLSVIIAEDDETSKMYFELIFNNEFKNITYTKTGKETIDKCRENPEINIILMDIKMPGMNGYDATREIRKFNSDVIIIAQTAFGLTGDREKAIEAGCNDYIAKPIKKEELEIIIKKHFKNYKKLITN